MVTLLRFLIGGFVVSAFAIAGSVFKPPSFAGLFGAAPSVALATLGLVIAKDGKAYAGTECRSMIAGAFAFSVYCLCVTNFLMKVRLPALTSALSAMVLWFITAFGVWQMFLR